MASDAVMTSAKTGAGVDEVLEAIVAKFRRRKAIVTRRSRR
jgi:translation elongation factor EF-4